MGDALKEEPTGQERTQALTLGALALNPTLHVAAVVALQMGCLSSLGLGGIISVMRAVHHRDAQDFSYFQLWLVLVTRGL